MPADKPDKSALDRQAVLEKIAGFDEPHRAIAERLHATILEAVPRLKPRLWYGMPGYATGRSTPVLAFFRVDDGHMTLGLSEHATVEREANSALRPAAWVVDEADDRTLQRVAALVRTAVG